MPWCGGYPMGFMMIWWVVGIVLVVVAVAAIARRWPPQPSTPHDTPEQILKRRYASGEIDRETYERTLDDLRR